MANTMKTYRSGHGPLPNEILRWHLHGAGIDSLEEVRVAMPEFGDNELLVRHDACGICFSDIKIINLGPEHPRLQNRNMTTHPVIMGHEISLTVVGVGKELQDRFRIGERYTVQADVYYHGVNASYGYALDGGMAQYGVVTKEVLFGDEGCYLIPVKDSTGYAEAALVEPWACVVAAYEYPNYRSGIRDGGAVLEIQTDTNVQGSTAGRLCSDGHKPAKVVCVQAEPSIDAAALVASETNGQGFDDVVIFGKSAEPALIEAAASALGKQGTFTLLTEELPEGRVALDIGKIHYDQHLYVSGPSGYVTNQRRDIKPGGKAAFLGAGGPMGQMHIQRAVMQPEPPATIVVTDLSLQRLERLKLRFSAIMERRNIQFVAVDLSAGQSAEEYGPYDDIISLVPSAALVEESIGMLAENGVYNIFAGVARGTMASLPLGNMMRLNQRVIGTSGSSIRDLKHTLDLVQSGQLSTNASLAAIGGLDALRDGLLGVKAGAVPGKTVIYPTLPSLPLLSLDQLKEAFPTVHAKLESGAYWTNEAEQELFEQYWRTASH